jgi:hypothetical protein
MPAANELLSCFHIHQRDYKWVFHAHQNWNLGKIFGIVKGVLV